jgi:hypothetical protein
MQAIQNHKILNDQRGKLVAIESNSGVPFDIKRVFYIYGMQANLPRGNHAHYKTKQYIIAVNGSCQVTLDNGAQKKKYLLDAPNIGLLQDAMIWGTMHTFSSDCLLLVLASENYNDADYIRSYEDYLRLLSL